MRLRFGRRTFLKAAGATAAGTLVPAAVGADAERARKPRVAIATSSEFAGKTSDLPNDAVSRIVGRAVMAAAAAATPEEAWKALFKPSDRVAVKVNTLAGPQLSTHPSVAAAVVAGLLSAGLPGENIIVFDRSGGELSKVGFKPGKEPSGVTCAGTDSEYLGYSDSIITSGQTGSLWSRVLTNFATAIVNVPVLKDHDLSGVSLGMKNFFGVIHNPNKYHDNGCDPYIADLCSSPLIRGRLRLVVIDGLRAQADGGPAYSPGGAYAYAGVIAGTDPVATDRVGWAEIETLRAKLGSKPLEAAGRMPKHILTAAQRGLGVADMDKIEVVRAAV